MNNDEYFQITLTVIKLHLSSFIIFTVSPLNVRFVADEQPLTAQRQYDLVCESTGSRPPAKLTWYKDNNRLERTKDSVSYTYIVRKNVI